MAVGSGLASQLGVAKESTYGTRVAPTKFYEYASESLKITRHRIFSKGLRAGRSFQSSTRVHTPTRKGDGDVVLEVANQGMGTLFDLFHGMTPTVVQQGATAAWLQTHNVGITDPNKSATVQIGTPGTDGTVRVFEYEGCMVTAFKFECSVGGFLELTLTLDSEDRTTSQSLASASYPSNLRTFHFGQCTPTINSVAVTDVFDSVTISGTLNRKTDRFKLGGAGLQAKPIQNEFYDVDIEFGGDFKDLTFTTLYDADTIVPVIVDFQGPLIAGTYKEFITFTFANCLPDIEDPDVTGPDVLSQGLKFNALDSGSGNPMVITYQSLDTAI